MLRFAVCAAVAVLVFGWEDGCGQSKYDDAGGLVKGRIVGGQESRPNEFPWQARLQSDFGRYYCGAIIISRNWVMTAAHCTYGDTPSFVNIVVGDHSRSTIEETEEIYRVSVIRLHPEYSPLTFNNDISVMQTIGPISLNENVAAVCAPESNDDYNGRTAVVSGWGSLFSGGPCCPDTLQYVQVPVISNDECNTVEYPGEITDGMICAGDRPNADACEIDTGGPLVVKEGNTFFVIGIVSLRFECASGNAGIYARVSTYLDWIGNV